MKAAPASLPREPQRPFGRPEGLRAFAAFHGVMALALLLLPRVAVLHVTPGREVPPPALDAQEGLRFGLLAAAACALLLLAAWASSAAIVRGRLAPGRRGRWARLTLLAGVATLGLVPLRAWAGRGREPGSLDEVASYLALLGGGAVLVLAGWGEVRRARRMAAPLRATLAGVFRAKRASDASVGPAVPEPPEGTVARVYADKPPRVGSGGGGGVLRVAPPRDAGFHGFGQSSGQGAVGSSVPLRVVHARRNPDDQRPVRAIPGLRITLALVVLALVVLAGLRLAG